MIKLCDPLDCTGCGSCYSICPKGSIQMLPSKEGFLYPKIDAKSCIACGLCQKKCPILNPVKHHEAPRAYASWSLDKKVHTTSSSGGLFSELSRWIFKREGIVFGVVMTPELDAVHRAATSMDEIEPMKGSKYFQSHTGGTYQEVKKALQADKWVLYSGTPCQIAGLLKYLTPTHYPKLLTVDMVCHGVPSSLFFKEYIHKLEGLYPQIEGSSYRFRSFDRWDFQASLISKGERVVIAEEHNIYMRLFLRNYLFRESCYKCPYTRVERVSDLTIADFWGIGDTTKFEHDTTQGVSLCLVNTDKGAELFQQIGESVFSEERALEEALVLNHQLHTPSKRPKSGRKIIYRYFMNHTMEQTEFRLAWRKIIKRKIRGYLRVLRGKKRK